MAPAITFTVLGLLAEHKREVNRLVKCRRCLGWLTGVDAARLRGDVYQMEFRSPSLESVASPQHEDEGMHPDQSFGKQARPPAVIRTGSSVLNMSP